MFVGEEIYLVGICKEKNNNYNMVRRIGNYKNVIELVLYEEYNILGIDVR